MGKRNKKAWSEDDWNAWVEYASELSIEEQVFEGTVIFPAVAEAILSQKEVKALDVWRSRCVSTLITGTPLIRLSTITLENLAAFCRWQPPDERSMRRHFLHGAVKHLREQVEVKNRRQFLSYEGRARNSKLCALARSIWHMNLADLEAIIETTLGLFGSSFSEVLAATSDLLDGGVAELKAGLSKIRNIVDQDEREAAFQAVAIAAHSSPLDRLVYLARGQVRCDIHGAELGVEGELRLEDELRGLGVDFVTEVEQREVQQRLFGKLRFPTPDILLRRPVRFADTEVAIRWLDSKNTVVLPGYTMPMRVEKLNTQLEKYVYSLGEGAVIWMNGYVAALHKPIAVRYLRPVAACIAQGETAEERAAELDSDARNGDCLIERLSASTPRVEDAKVRAWAAQGWQ